MTNLVSLKVNLITLIVMIVSWMLLCYGYIAMSNIVNTTCKIQGHGLSSAGAKVQLLVAANNRTVTFDFECNPSVNCLLAFTVKYYKPSYKCWYYKTSPETINFDSHEPGEFFPLFSLIIGIMVFLVTPLIYLLYLFDLREEERRIKRAARAKEHEEAQKKLATPIKTESTKTD